MRNDMLTSTPPRTVEYPAQATRMAHAECCKLFAACFYPPDKKLFVEEKITDKLAALLERACPDAAPLVPPAEKYIEGEDHVALSVGYTRLFLGPPEQLAPPYASFYLDPHGGVMGPSSVAILKFYKRANLRIDDEFNEMPDHVAAVLEFLYYLLYRETIARVDATPEKIEALEKTRAAFWNDYIFSWIPRFCGQVTTADQHPFYTGLAQCLAAFIRSGIPE